MSTGAALDCSKDSTREPGYGGILRKRELAAKRVIADCFGAAVTIASGSLSSRDLVLVLGRIVVALDTTLIPSRAVATPIDGYRPVKQSPAHFRSDGSAEKQLSKSKLKIVAWLQQQHGSIRAGCCPPPGISGWRAVRASPPRGTSAPEEGPIGISPSARFAQASRVPMIERAAPLPHVPSSERD